MDARKFLTIARILQAVLAIKACFYVLTVQLMVDAKIVFLLERPIVAKGFLLVLVFLAIAVAADALLFSSSDTARKWRNVLAVLMVAPVLVVSVLILFGITPLATEISLLENNDVIRILALAIDASVSAAIVVTTGVVIAIGRRCFTSTAIT